MRNELLARIFRLDFSSFGKTVHTVQLCVIHATLHEIGSVLSSEDRHASLLPSMYFVRSTEQQGGVKRS